MVEDTNNGHWLYESTGPHPIPVLSMAQSPLKGVEDSIIGDAVLFSIERVLREDFAASARVCAAPSSVSARSAGRPLSL
ncbi:MAG: hypothetical protein IPL90_11090 [Holophagales bacterium]|nr:hypothetical protein [Holophagales bacterium]